MSEATTKSFFLKAKKLLMTYSIERMYRTIPKEFTGVMGKFSCGYICTINFFTQRDSNQYSKGTNNADFYFAGGAIDN